MLLLFEDELLLELLLGGLEEGVIFFVLVCGGVNGFIDGGFIFLWNLWKVEVRGILLICFFCGRVILCVFGVNVIFL